MAGDFSVASPVGASGFSPTAMLFTYDELNQAKVACDANSLSTLDYDSFVVLTADSRGNQTVETRNLFGKSVTFVAAENVGIGATEFGEEAVGGCVFAAFARTDSDKRNWRNHEDWIR